jgi:hypothetical protein
MKLPSRRWLLALAAAIAGSSPWEAIANDRDLRATTVPAAICVAGGGTSGAIGGTWVNRCEYVVPGRFDGQSELVDHHLHCALSLNNVDLGGTTNDNDISSFTVFYRDSDGLGTGTSIEVDLHQTTLVAGNIQSVPVCSWRSNTSGNGSAGYTSSSAPCVHDMKATAFYHFEVRFLSSTVTQDVVASFVGIRFP